MNAQLTLKPGQPGTKKLMQVYGARLVCARYRYGRERQKRLKTVELIIAGSDWEPADAIPDAAMVGVRIDIDEIKLQKRVKSPWVANGTLKTAYGISAISMQQSRV